MCLVGTSVPAVRSIRNRGEVVRLRKRNSTNLAHLNRDAVQRNRQERLQIRPASSTCTSNAGMKKTLNSQAEAALARKAKKLAESQLRFTNPERLAATINDYIEWRAFAFWVRLVVETEGVVSPDMKRLFERPLSRVSG
jgi:hypothetical protein